LQARDEHEAVRVSNRHTGVIGLLLSSVPMGKGLNGLKLAQTLTARRPEMRVLLMSGFYCESPVVLHGWHFISKPFLPAALQSKIEEALELPKPRHFESNGGRNA